MKAIEEPVAGPKFSQLISRNEKMTIISDNQFRPTSVNLILPILDILEDKGCNVNLIFGCGAVPPLSDKEIEEKIGKKLVSRIGMERIINNEARKAENYVFIETTRQGTPV